MKLGTHQDLLSCLSEPNYALRHLVLLYFTKRNNRDFPTASLDNVVLSKGSLLKERVQVLIKSHEYKNVRAYLA